MNNGYRLKPPNLQIFINSNKSGPQLRRGPGIKSLQLVQTRRATSLLNVYLMLRFHNPWTLQYSYTASGTPRSLQKSTMGLSPGLR